ncbi:hypothetical protein GRS66_000497 [Saccharomyces pastorianus]|uniref:Uncharacterized protein n=1 Tax=Saccharomyces pastorianus TaxID=27292 RepID=A0A6C1DMK0_SACPS|nr:hypothetical protein GRS66_000497 [Saccharomyces pastorianus]
MSCCGCTARDLDIFDDNNGVAMWKRIALKDSYRISLVPSSDGISVCGKLWGELNNCFHVPASFCVIEKFCSEPKRGIDEYDSFFKYREIVLPKLRRDTGKMTAALKIIDELTVIRLPLSRATAQRIRRRYNKNGSSEPRLKTLDGLTSSAGFNG